MVVVRPPVVRHEPRPTPTLRCSVPGMTATTHCVCHRGTSTPVAALPLLPLPPPPGFTHLQNAMTVRWSHWLMCHCAAWQRDDMRLRDLLPRVATLPLGSGEEPARNRNNVQVVVL